MKRRRSLLIFGILIVGILLAFLYPFRSTISGRIDAVYPHFCTANSVALQKCGSATLVVTSESGQRIAYRVSDDVVIVLDGERNRDMLHLMPGMRVTLTLAGREALVVAIYASS